MFLDADYASIESRIVNWLAGQEDALAEYRQGVDRYKRMASAIYNVPENQVNKYPQRFVGKQATLGCSYGMGPSKFRMTCKKMGGYDLPPGLEDIAVKAFRLKHKKVVKLWYDLENAAKKAIARKGQRFTVLHLSFIHKVIEGMPFLLMRLPSGREIAYPRPRVIPHKRFEGKTCVVYFANIKGVVWGDVETWGGTFCENSCQGIAADVLFNGTHNAENAGYEVATLIHDQALAYVKPGQSVEQFVQLLTTLPPWADGLPIAAEGELVPFYKKS